MITVVSGLPRSGTSLLMQMLVAGGIEPLTDGLRQSDDDNPRGYYEWEPVKDLPERPELIAQAEGKVVKVISSLLFSLPVRSDYQVLFLRRRVAEVLRSQAKMVERRGVKVPPVPQGVLGAALEANVRQVAVWLQQRGMPYRWVEYHSLIADPGGESAAIARFLGVPLDLVAMAAQVDPSLHRNR